jgi:transcriptional regulator with XRE-family HTH domain
MAGKKKPTLAERVKDLRDGRGWSQYELARRAGLSKQTISHLESGERSRAVSWQTIQMLCFALDVSADEFRVAEPPTPEEPGKRGRPRKSPPA